MIVVLEGFLEKNMAKLPDEVPRRAASSAFLPTNTNHLFFWPLLLPIMHFRTIFRVQAYCLYVHSAS